MLSSQRIVYARYLLPLTPPLCVLAAAAVVSGVSLLRRYEIPRCARTALIAALTIAALLPPALIAVRGDRDMARAGTVDLAYQLDCAEHPGELRRWSSRSGRCCCPDQVPGAERVALRPKDYGSGATKGVDYLVASSEAYGPVLRRRAGGPQKFPREYAEYMRIFVQSREIARFAPSARSSRARASRSEGGSLTRRRHDAKRECCP